MYTHTNNNNSYSYYCFILMTMIMVLVMTITMMMTSIIVCLVMMMKIIIMVIVIKLSTTGGIFSYVCFNLLSVLRGVHTDWGQAQVDACGGGRGLSPMWTSTQKIKIRVH